MKAESGLRNQLKAVRTRLHLSQQELASAAGVARQTIGGIEAELYAPSAAVALRLAKALGCRVEELFWLDEDTSELEARRAKPTTHEAANGDEAATRSGRVLLGRIGNEWIAHELEGEAAFRTEMVPSDGVTLPPSRPVSSTNNEIRQRAASDTVSVRLLDDVESLVRTVLLAGCAPSLSLWARSAERWHPGLRVGWMLANSTNALEKLARGEVHAAGVHLSDPLTGTDNAPFVRRLCPNRDIVLVTLGAWEEGLIVAPGNPKTLRQTSDLARPDVTLINREMGAGSRLLLDSLLTAEGIAGETVAGYGRFVTNHLDVARTIASGQSDVGVSVASIAVAFGLDFVPLRTVRYDLAIVRDYMDSEPVQQLLETLQHRWVLSQLKALGGYDTTHTGEITPVL